MAHSNFNHIRGWNPSVLEPNSQVIFNSLYILDCQLLYDIIVTMRKILSSMWGDSLNHNKSQSATIESLLSCKPLTWCFSNVFENVLYDHGSGRPRLLSVTSFVLRQDLPVWPRASRWLLCGVPPSLYLSWLELQ